MGLRKLLMLTLLLGLLVGVVGAVPAAASHDVSGKVCLVTLEGDALDSSTAAGAKAAQAKFHVATETRSGTTNAELAAHIAAFVAEGDCDLIMGVGFSVAFLLEPFIVAHPEQRFAAIDWAFGGFYDNAAEIFFLPDQAAFLAGYIAAGVTETGKVGVFGGLPVPTVTLFMDGYALGVEYYNAQHGTAVEVLGWDPATQTGLFSFDFGDPAAGQALASSLYDQGADIVFPVAGFTSFGAAFEAAERKAAGEDVLVIGVDFDWVEAFGDPDRIGLTSVVKNYGAAVVNQIEALIDGTWSGGFVFEGLEGGAVDIAPFHKLNRDVPGFLKHDLKAIRVGIVDGSIDTSPIY